jgi:peptidoglycan/xylan/chitin deacetylase (PgdA/CDA1 family)
MPPARIVLYAATSAVLAMTGFAVFVRPPPLLAAGFALAAYSALLLGGVFLLRWRVFVDAIVSGPPRARGVVLTFDDGPHPGTTSRILDLLARHGACATFFVVGRKAEAYPELVRAILGAGHEIGLHSYAHDRLFALRPERRVREDLERGIAALERITGRRPVLFRPPIGHSNPIIARVADALGLVVVGWTIAGHDGVSWARSPRVVARVKRRLRDGAIVLLHDSAERGDREPASLLALPEILAAIGDARLDVAPLTRWVEALESRPSHPAGEGSTI